MTAGEAFAVILCGVTVISIEFLRPGRVLPLVVGLIVTAWGVRDLAHWPISIVGLGLIALSICLFATEAFWRVNYLAGSAGACCLAVSFPLLVKQPASIPWVEGVTAGVLFGAWMVLLFNSTKRARRNKQSDLTAEN